MQAAIDDLARLATTISQDRKTHTNCSKVLLNAHVSGQGFIDSTIRDDDNITAEGGDNASSYQNLPLLADDGMEILEDGDSANSNDGSDEDLAEYRMNDYPDRTVAVDWLNSLAPHIKSLHSTNSTTPCPGLVLEPKAYQSIALAKIEHNRDSPLKAILIGDPPGLGKTFPAMMAVVKAKAEAKRFSIIVVTPSCLPQWRSEFDKFFLPDTVRVFVLRDSHTSPMELLKYDVVLTTYPFLISQYRKILRFTNAVANYKKKENLDPRHLERPDVSIFSEIFQQRDGVKSPYLVLDEVTAVKNASSLTHGAVKKLRGMADTCIMLSGNPIDNTWFDVYALLQLVDGHIIDSPELMRSLFASRSAKGKYRSPKGRSLSSFLQLLNSFSVRRPEDCIDLPELEVQNVSFHLNNDEAAESDYHFHEFTRLSNMETGGSQLVLGVEKAEQWKHLSTAVYHAYHPEMAHIAELLREPPRQDHAQIPEEGFRDQEEVEKWMAWREQLQMGDQWRSSRITALIDLFNQRRDIDPNCSVLVFDESVFFLDIVQVAFQQMYNPVECLCLNGRDSPEKRPAILQEFEAAAGAKVLLISRGAGRIGLNITSANVVILCGPWWKKEWENQAIKRAHRTGQVREVFAFKLMADNCMVEEYKAKIRDRKNKHNTMIMKQITRKDGDVPKVWDNLD